VTLQLTKEFISPGAEATPELLTELGRKLTALEKRIADEVARVELRAVRRYTAKTTSVAYAALPWDLVLCATAGTTLSVTLLSPSALLVGVRIGVARRSGTAAVRVTSPGSTISGAAFVDVATADVVEFVCTGAAWDLAASAEPPRGDLFKVLTAGEVGQNVNTAQPWFPTAGAVTVAASTTYAFEGLLHTVRTAGVLSHTTSLLFGGTVTITSLRYEAFVKSGDSAASGTCNASMIAVAAAFVVKAASVSASENVAIYVRGTIRINAGGTLIPQFIYSAAPGGAPTVQADSFFYLKKLGSNVVASQGTWA